MQMHFDFDFLVEKSPIKVLKSPNFTILTARERKIPLLSLLISYSSLCHFDKFIRENETPFSLEQVPSPSCLNFLCFPRKFTNKIEFYLKDLIPSCQLQSISSFLRIFGLEWHTPPEIFYEDLFKDLKLKFQFPKEPQKVSKTSNLLTSFLVFSYKQMELKFYKYGRIGSGAFGYVELVGIEPHNKLSAKYCVKFFSFPNDPDQREIMLDQLINEISALSMLSHPNLVDFIQAFVKKDSQNKYQNICLLMNYCNGGNLDEYIKNNGPLTEETALDFLSQLLQGLQYLHNKKKHGKAPYFHGDIKPKNILLHSPEDHPKRIIIKIADFGCAKRVLKNGAFFNQEIGTKSYRAPQVLRNEKYTDKCDIWSLGIVLYYILIGQVPWGSENVTDYQIDNILKEKKMDELIDEAFQKRQCKPISNKTLDLLKKMLKIEEEDRINWINLSKDYNFLLPEHLSNSQSHYVAHNPGDSYKASCKNLLSVQTTDKKVVNISSNLQMIAEFEPSPKDSRVFDDLDLAVSAQSFVDVEEEEKKVQEKKKEKSNSDASSGKWDTLNENSTYVDYEKDSKELLMALQMRQKLLEGLNQSEIIGEIIESIEKYNELLGLELIFLETLEFLLRKLGNIFVIYNIQELDEYKLLFNKTSELLEWREKCMNNLENAKIQGDRTKNGLVVRIVNILNHENLHKHRLFLDKYKIDERFIEELLSDCVKDKELFTLVFLDMFQTLLEKTKQRILIAKNSLDLMEDGYSRNLKIEEIKRLLEFFEKLLGMMSFGHFVKKEDENSKDLMNKTIRREMSIEEKIVHLGVLN